MKKTIVSFVIGIIFGFLLSEVVFTLVSSSDYIDNEKKYGIVELIYYWLQPLSVLGTFLALLVAIFGAEIKNMFFSPVFLL